MTNIVVNGKIFNEKHKGIKFYKLTNRECIHNGLLFEEGEVHDILDFNPKQLCGPGGIYFVNFKYIPAWINYNDNGLMWYIWNVIIPNDAMVCYENMKYKTNKIILSNRTEIWTDSYYICHIFKTFRENYEYTKYININTPEIENLLIRGLTNKYINLLDINPKILTDKIVKYGISIEPYFFKNIPDNYKTKDICIFAINETLSNLDYVPVNLLTEILYEIISNDPLIIKHINIIHLTYDTSLHAFNLNVNALEYIPFHIQKHMIDNIKDELKKDGRLLKYISCELRTYDICEIAINQNFCALMYTPYDIEEQFVGLFFEMLNKNGENLRYISNDLITLEMCIDAVHNMHNISSDFLSIIPSQFLNDIYELLIIENCIDVSSIPIEHRTGKICKLLVQVNIYYIEYVPEIVQHEIINLIEQIITQDGMLLKYIVYDLRSIKLCTLALDQNVNALIYIPMDIKYKIIKKIKTIVAMNGLLIQHISRDILYKMPTLCKIAMENNIECQKFIPADLIHIANNCDNEEQIIADTKV